MVPGLRAVELIYHSYLTGLILMLVSRAGAAKAAEVVFRTFRRQQLAEFPARTPQARPRRLAGRGGVRRNTIICPIRSVA